jgi:hypothetical protein
MSTFVLAPLALLSAAAPATAQDNRYMGQEPARVSVEELVRTGMMYNERPVIVRGELNYSDNIDTDNSIYELRGKDSLRTIRVALGARSFEDLRFKIGNQVQITGVFFDLSSVNMPERHPLLRYFPGVVRQDNFGDKNFFIAIMSIADAEPIESDLKPEDMSETPDIVDPDIDASGLTQVDLRELVKDPSAFVGKEISVLGKFRGSNLYGDLSIRDKRTPRDFVIKVADAAIWVTGRRPRGKDFRLDPDKRRDTGEWLRIVGEPWEFEGTYYLKAIKVELAEDPEDPDLEPVKVALDEEEEAGPPPEVAFSLPIDGDRGVALDTEFQVQFSKPMKAQSFHRNVDLLYGDDDGFGNPFPDLEVLYDDTNRTLTVRPHKELEPDKEIRLILYDAIEDDEGQKLVVQPSAAEVDPAAAVVLTFTTARS